ncbi:MAG TPA: 30S ribosome-binding factor RbfA [Gammaproteobacteria bacterium]|nr:30S ribosome-binding factor RbfA [Gammaproteobacteria bacterium]
MPAEFSRTRRVGEQIQRDLAELIRSEVRDPRLGMVTVNHVDVSRDMSYAKVYITVMGEPESREVSLSILNKMAGYLRSQIGRRMKLRIIPELKFLYDESIDRGARIDSLLRNADPFPVAEDDQADDDPESS